MNKIQLLCCFFFISTLTYAQDGLTNEESGPSEEEWICEENEWWENGEGEGSSIIVYCDVTPNPDPTVCPQIYDPVCGYPLGGGEGKTYSNSCVACNSGADHYYEGECPN